MLHNLASANATVLISCHISYHLNPQLQINKFENVDHSSLKLFTQFSRCHNSLGFPPTFLLLLLILLLWFFSPSRIFLFKYQTPPAFVKPISSVHTIYLCQPLSCQEAIEKFLLNNEHIIFSKYNYHHQKYQLKKFLSKINYSVFQKYK